MKSLIQFITEQLNITEGGHAVECRPMTQLEAKATFEDFAKNVLTKLGLTQEGTDFAPLGSYQKKKADQTSGDLDVAVSMDIVAGENGIALDDVEQWIADRLDEMGYEYNWMPGLHVISVQYPIPNSTGFGQVDIMPTDNIMFSRWMYSSPDFTKSESKYKGLYRNVLLVSIMKMAYKKILKTTDKGEIEEFEEYSLRRDKGLMVVRRSHMGARGLVKNPKLLKEFDQLVTQEPQKIIDLVFTDTDAQDLISFESVWTRFMGAEYKYPQQRDAVVKHFVDTLKQQKFPIPAEVADAYPQYCGE